MQNTLRVIMAQVNFLLGDIEGNAERIIELTRQAAKKKHADIIVFPELTLTGYPPEDLLLRPGLHRRVSDAMQYICSHLEKSANDIYAIVGYPQRMDEYLFNSAAILHKGKIIANYHKQCLPNYGVFDEKRYFKRGSEACIFEVKGIPIAVNICEDLWFPETMAQAKAAGAKLMLDLNASPFDMHKPDVRENVLYNRATEGNMPIVYVHGVSGQDELIFDGGSMVVDANGKLCEIAKFYQEDMHPVDFTLEDGLVNVAKGELPSKRIQEERVYGALVLGVRDYVHKNGFEGAILGLSGGIDSALSLAIAVDALGKDNVEAYMMPSRHTSELSLRGAEQEAKALEVKYSVIPIEETYKAFLNTLEEEFSGFPEDLTEENLQARCRGTILMALSNKHRKIVLTTGNKSELAVGYCTLYGDMAGGFCVLKDVPKTMVMRLASYRNTLSRVIPQEVIDRPPSAELAPEQHDQETLPPYDVLDKILELYVEKDQSVDTICAAGFDEATVKKIVKLVDRNEYKRRQAPPGVRVTSRAFGRDRRYPMTHGFGKFYQD